MREFKLTDIFIGIIFAVFFTSIGVIAAVNFRFIYYMDISFLDIVKTSGYPLETIIENYDALINYNSPFFKGDLVFPSMIASANGLQHFVEVKRIFVSFYWIALITLTLCMIIIIYKTFKKDKTYLRISSITVLVLPLLVGLGAGINFDKIFVAFHKLVFRNDYWLFDPSTDPIITILPDTYFFHALLVIILFIVLGSLALYISFRIGNKNRRSRHRRRY